MSEENRNTHIREEAAFWVARLSDGNLREKEKQKFHEWVKRSPYHEREIRELAKLWDGLDNLLAKDAFKAVTSSRSVLQRRPVFTLTSVFAFIFMIVLIASQFIDRSFPSRVSASYFAEIGQQKSVKLADGSHLLLNTNSQVEVNYSDNKRTIRLLKGEVFFDVAHNEKAPFVVLAKSGAIRALGTAFSVRLTQADIAVVVTEGRVELSTLTNPENLENKADTLPMQPKLLMNLEAGQSARFTDRIDAVENIDTDEIEKKLAWRSELLIFEGETLEQVIQDVSRYTPNEIIIRDPNLQNLRITGVFPTGKVSALMHTLDESFNIDVAYGKDKRIYLSRNSK